VNVGSYFGYIDEAQYVAGTVAGLSTKTGKLGFIAAKPIPQVLLRNVNSFALGARSVNPAATVKVVFTGDWSMPVKEAEAADSLIDQGDRRFDLPCRQSESHCAACRETWDLFFGLPREPDGDRAKRIFDWSGVGLEQRVFDLREARFRKDCL